jgi:hypothetical protein
MPRIFSRRRHPKPPRKTPEEVARENAEKRREFVMTMEERYNNILRQLSNSNQRNIAIQNFKKELPQIREGYALLPDSDEKTELLEIFDREAEKIRSRGGGRTRRNRKSKTRRQRKF